MECDRFVRSSGRARNTATVRASGSLRLFLVPVVVEMFEAFVVFEQLRGTCQLEKCLFEIGRLGAAQQTGYGIERRELPLMDHRNAMRKLLDFRECVRSKEQRRFCAT